MFELTDTPSLGETAFIARIPNGLTTTDALMHSLFDNLRLPGYFGFNWNALSECLRDLHWIANHEVVILHGEIPLLPEPDLILYLDTLHECVESWALGEEHSLRVIFPASTKLQRSR